MTQKLDISLSITSKIHVYNNIVSLLQELIKSIFLQPITEIAKNSQFTFTNLSPLAHNSHTQGFFLYWCEFCVLWQCTIAIVNKSLLALIHRSQWITDLFGVGSDVPCRIAILCYVLLAVVTLIIFVTQYIERYQLSAN